MPIFALALTILSQMIGIVSLIGNGGLGLEAIDGIMGQGDLVALAGRTDRRTGRPRASVAAWILVLCPPQDRPNREAARHFRVSPRFVNLIKLKPETGSLAPRRQGRSAAANWRRTPGLYSYG